MTVGTPTPRSEPTHGVRPPDPRPAGAVPYADYVRLDTLLSLQRTRTDVPAEMSFLIASQVMELLFALLRHEWTIAGERLDADDVVGATDTLRRSVRELDVLVSAWDLLATLTPGEFGAFREELGEASGFQSHLYRHLEFLLGIKRAGVLRGYVGAPDVHAELERALRAPSLYDRALDLLARRGLRETESGRPDPSRPYEPTEDVERAWAGTYTDGTHDLVALGEVLTDISERWTRWRERHLAATLRALGNRPGTGGSAGASWLEQTVRVRVFPELWTMRTLVEPSKS
ncbi:tryptophan 2,3-dioxygenase [Embleya hyalina]|uniref:Tryptophan 2,3-dioxygenase n=1 Tax=Embleya hyalina TaxID=516124 RepID=A0A401YRG8_9ACTN|nr:tryptophan 2,3-dioxygenase family protein [Embleya hyalina]GCD97176.1 tryptophan 2,3-dioxygenase [Embleya hyalina]